jgi:hypothetical protein
MSDTVVKGSENDLRHRVDVRRMPAWLAVVLLVVALGAGALVGRATKADPPAPADLASASTRAWLRDHVAAVNSGDEARIRAFYADDATQYDIGNQHSAPIRGGANIARIAAANQPILGQFLNEPGTAVQRGQFIAYVGSWGDVKAGVVVYELDPQGRILNMWAIHPAQ